MRRSPRLLRAALAAAGLAGLAACGTLGCLTLDSFLFNPDPEPEGGYDFSDSTIPSALCERLTLTAEDGTAIDAFWVEAYGEATILYFHGNGENLGHYWERVEILHDLDYNVLIIDYHGYGASGGEPSEEGCAMDARAAYNYAVDERGIDPGALVYYGYSLGGAVAIHLAAERPPAALVTEAAFGSIQDFVTDSTGLDFPASLFADSIFDNVGQVGGVAAPYLILHGTEDHFVAFRYAEELYEARAGSAETTVLHPVVGADHGTIPYVDLLDYAVTVADFVDCAVTGICL